MALAPEEAEVRQADGSWQPPARARRCRWAPWCACARRARAARRRGHRGQQRDRPGAASPARASRSTRGRATRSSPAPSTRPASCEFRVTAAAGDTTLGAHHPRGRGGAGHARADAALRRPLRRGLHAGRVRAGAGAWPCCAPLLLGWPWLDAHLQGAGAAGDRLPVRAGDLDAGHGGQRAGRGRAARHPDQGRHLPGSRRAG